VIKSHLKTAKLCGKIKALNKTDKASEKERFMNINEKSIYKSTLIMLAVVNFLLFLVYHLTIRTIGGTACAFIFFYTNEVVEFTLPLISAAALYCTYKSLGVAAVLIKALPYSLATVLFKFPYHAFEYAYEGIEIGGVMLFSALNALLNVIVYYIEITVLFLLINIVSNRVVKKNQLPKSKPIFVIAKPFDLDLPINLGLLAASVAMLIYKLVFEIIDTVEFVINYIDSYRIGEIAYMTFRYIFLIILMISAYCFTALYKNHLISKNEK
jgi:hypothetical protein